MCLVWREKLYARKMAKRTFNSAFNLNHLPPEEEIGYISKVSDQLTSKKMNRYFQGELQTQSTTYRYVHFNVEMHQEFVKANKLNSPIKLYNYKLSPNNDGKLELILNRNSKLEFVKSAPFKRKLDFDTAIASTSRETESLTLQIKNIDVNKTHQKCSIVAKVIQQQNEENVVVYGTMKKKKDFKVADNTAVITITLFENQYNNIQEGKTYIFKNMSTRNYNGPKLTSTQATTIEETDNIEDVSQEEINDENKCIKGTIEQIQCITKFKCAVCEKTINIDDPLATKIKCTGCNLKSNVKSLKENLTCRINFKDHESQTYALVAFQNAITAFLQNEGKPQLLQNLDQLEDFLLDVPEIKCIVKKDNIVISLSIEHQ